MATKTQKKNKTKRSGRKTAKADRTTPPTTVYKKGEFEKYGLFMALPTEERKEIFGFATDKAFAKAFKVHHGTLSEWKLREELWTVRDRYLVGFKKHTAKIIAALAKRAERTGEAFHSMTFLKVVEGFTEKTGLDITSKGKRVGGFKVVVRHAAHSPTSSRDKAGR